MEEKEIKNLSQINGNPVEYEDEMLFFDAQSDLVIF
jgi:hypothetical protein